MVSESRIVARIQRVYAEQAPENERCCDWWRSMEEPWRSLARELEVA